MDELHRHIQLEAFSLSFAVTSIVTFSYGFLENVGFPSINMIFVFPFMILVWGLGTAIASRRFQ